MSGSDLDGMAAEILQEALQLARRDAVVELRSRIASRLVQSAEALAGAPGAAAGVGAGPVRSDVSPAPAPPGSGSARSAGDPAPGRPVRDGWYVYGVTRMAAVTDLGPLHGVAGAAVETVPVGGLAVVGSRLDGAERSWGIDGSGEADPAALLPRIREHEEVLETLLDRGPVLPFRFGRLYPATEEIGDLVRRHAGRISAALERLENRVEWGLTIEWEAAPRSGAVAGGRGADYLTRRRDDMAAAAEVSRAARAAARRIHEAVASVAVADVVRPGRRPERGERPVAWRASYLVDRDRTEAFRQAAADGLSAAPDDLGLTGELTGPWPPYEFSELDLGGSAA